MNQTVPADFANAEDGESLQKSSWFPWESGDAILDDRAYTGRL